MKEIPLYGGLVVIVDDEDYEALSTYKWYSQNLYAVRNVDGGQIRMHRVILDAPPDLQVDHVNMNTLDNRRANLRLATRGQNGANRKSYKNSTSPLKGVCWHKRDQYWRAQIRANGRVKHLGCFNTQEEAHAAYCAAAEKYHGEFARTA